MKHQDVPIIDRRRFLKSSTSTALLATVSGAAIRRAEARTAVAQPGFNPEMSFTREEYAARWEKVQSAMSAAGYDTLLVWQRSASTYDKVGDVYWLTNFYTNGTGQESTGEDLDEPWTFAAVLIRKGREPELHTGLAEPWMDASRVVCGKRVTHAPHMTASFADYLRTEKIDGRVAVVGDDVLPARFDRILRYNSPQIEWVADDTFLQAPQLIKSARELDIYRVAGGLVSDALTAAMHAMLAGERACEAAARAAGVIMRGGGGFHRISISHGPAMPSPLSYDFYGYDMKAPSPGDLFAVWIYGPIFAGYWADPGRSAVCGRRPTAEQKKLLETCATLVADMVVAVRPGVATRDLAVRWEQLAQKTGYFDEQAGDDLFGHGLGTGFPEYTLPMGDAAIGPFGYTCLQGTIKPGMVLAAEAFMRRPAIGSVGFENNFIVTHTGVEVIDKTPMLFW